MLLVLLSISKGILVSSYILKIFCVSYVHLVSCITELSPDEVMPNYANFCAGFLKATTRHICHRVQRAIEFCELNNMFKGEAERTLVFSGGVACNYFIYTALVQLGEEYGYKVVRPPPKHCTDNGAMIAWNGIERYKHIKIPLNKIFNKFLLLGFATVVTSLMKWILSI